jgi:hypothetical protein
VVSKSINLRTPEVQIPDSSCIGEFLASYECEVLYTELPGIKTGNGSTNHSSRLIWYISMPVLLSCHWWDFLEKVISDVCSFMFLRDLFIIIWSDHSP